MTDDWIREVGEKISDWIWAPQGEAAELIVRRQDGQAFVVTVTRFTERTRLHSEIVVPPRQTKAKGHRHGI